MKTCPNAGGFHPRTHLKRLALALLCLALALAATCADAAGRGEKTVRVGWFRSSFNSTDESGRRTGFGYEYQMKIASYAGWRYEYIQGSWPDLFQMLIDGKIDLLSDVSRTEEREELMLYPSLPMGSEEYFLYVSQENTGVDPSDIFTLNGKKIGVNRDSVQAGFYREWAEENGIRTEIIELANGEGESLRMLLSGELDGYVTMDSLAAEPEAQNGRIVPMVYVGSSDFYFAVNREREDLLEELENAMYRIREENQNYGRDLLDRMTVRRGTNAFLSEKEKNWLGSHGGKIRVGYQDNYLAFCATDPATGELTGALKDFLEMAGESVANAHVGFETRGYATADDAIEALQRGEVDCVFPANLTQSEGEDAGLHITPEMIHTGLLAVVRQSDHSLFGEREHVLVAVNEGNLNYDSCLKNNFPLWRTVYYPTTDDCLRAVSQGVADCVLISSYRYNNIARQCERLRLTTVPTGLELGYSFAVAAGEPEVYSLMARLTGLVPETAVNMALSRYTSEDARTTLKDFIEQNAWAVISGIAALMFLILGLLIWNLRARRRAASLIRATETDVLTGLYNRDYFLEYAGRMHREHPEARMDAVVLNIDRFHAVNAINGREYGDKVLKTLGSEIGAETDRRGGIAGRFEADRFEIFCPHREDYEAMYDRLQEKLDGISNGAGIRLRMGVMPWQAGMEAVQMFDRARTACGMARDSYKGHLVIFNEKMQEREDYEQRLLNDLPQALGNFEFEVYYQPQYDIRDVAQRPVGAEALVRWNHPKLGMIPPGDFVPLFERNGKIGEVDRYVWAEAARQVARWREQFGVTVPVSVNLSRVDVFDPELESALEKLLAYNGLKPDNIKLEVTESAYTGNADQVIRVVKSLRRKGFVVEMDDFGSGYSSLNMLSAMPVDVLKMDRAFIQRICEDERDEHMVALIIEIAASLKVPVVAEGVETEGQLKVLRKLGCPLVQGFYFSRPLPAGEFERQVIPEMARSGKGDEACDR